MTIERKKKKTEHSHSIFGVREWRMKENGGHRSENRYDQGRIDKYALERQNEVTFIIPTGGIDSERV